MTKIDLLNITDLIVGAMYNMSTLTWEAYFLARETSNCQAYRKKNNDVHTKFRIACLHYTIHF
jgi:hypothetical protein